MARLNATHDASRRSWIETANAPGAEFPLQNLPFGLMQRGDRARHGCVAIGDQAFDLVLAAEAGLFTGVALDAARAAQGASLNRLLSFGGQAAASLRAALFDLLAAGGAGQSRIAAAPRELLTPLAEVALVLPVEAGSFTDFLSSIDHTRRMGRGKLPQAFQHLPIAYHSRATSVRVSGEPVVRPNGQFGDAEGKVCFGPEPWLDYELELGAVLAYGNELGAPFPAAAAADRLFGFCLLNDWSARGIQFLEAMPLGPFLGKSLSTTLSPWLVTAEALAPFRTAATARGSDDPPVPAHLSDADDLAGGGFDIALDALLLTPAMRRSGTEPALLTRTNARHLYWTFAQMITHHASNGCNLRTGDLIGSGTVSGPTDESRACLAEITERGTKPFALPNGESRTWLLDGDEIIFRGRASRDGFVGLGFGEARATIAPAPAWPG